MRMVSLFFALTGTRTKPVSLPPQPKTAAFRTRPGSSAGCACFSLLLGLLFATPLHAQRVRWEPPGGSLAVRQTSQLSLIFEDCEPTGEFTLPQIPNLSIGQASRGEQTSFNIVNGQAARSKTVYFSYPVRPSDRQTITIPSFTVQTDRGALQVPAATFQVGDATVGNSSIPLDTAANSRISVGSGQLWAGEVVPIEYVLSVANRFPANLASAPEWNPAPLVVEEWSKPEPGSAVISGENRTTVAYRSRGYIRQPGSYTLGSVNQLVNIRVPSSNFSIFQAFQAEQYTITSNSPQLVVRPLPAPSPAEFNGAVGTFQLNSTVVPAQAAVGEPITWTLELSGVGNWPDIAGLPTREVSRDFRVVQPQARRTNAEGKLFEATLTEDVVLIPTRPGTYRLGPIRWAYFDPKTGKYQTISTEPVTVTVAPGAAPSPAGATTPSASGSAPVDSAPATEPAPAVRTAPAPVAPSAIPRDPLPSAGHAPVPWRGRPLVVSCCAILAIVPITWLLLAWRRALRTDQGRAAREARARLRTTLAAMRNGSDQAEKQTLLHTWRQDTTTLWGVRQAVPAASAFAGDSDWMTLWTESERVLFGKDSTLPPDWVPRAEKALSRRPAPRFRARTVFRSQNLLPVLALLGVLTIGANVAASAERSDSAAQTAPFPAAREAYDRGDFRTAERRWRDAAAAAPTDWAAHHNLALALAQQQRYPEAAAHALVAFVQHPRDPSVRWHFAYTLGRAGYAPVALNEFATPDVLHRIAWLLSPTEWQWAIIAAAALVALAAILALLRGYRVLGRTASWLAATSLLLALVLAMAAAVSLPRFGPARDPRAVLIWKPVALRSLPTEVASEQQATTLAAGSLAVVDKDFLGWRRLVFPNGQTGWVRKEEFLALWGTK
jgi:tetratricopeptide (TPR) repeat protein